MLDLLKDRRLYHEDFVNSLLIKIPIDFVNLFLLDPPYGIDHNNNIDYDDSDVGFSCSLLAAGCWRVLKKQGNLIIFTGWSRMETIKSCFYAHGWILNNRIIWDRQKYRGATRNLPNSAEDILWFSKTDSYTFNKQESLIKKVTKGFGTKNGRENRIVTNVWSDIPPLVPWGEEYRDGEGYKGQKPVSLLSRVIEIFSNPGDLVVDGFCGSGSTAIASIRTGRDYIVCDKSEKAMKITQKRIDKETANQ